MLTQIANTTPAADRDLCTSIAPRRALAAVTVASALLGVVNVARAQWEVRSLPPPSPYTSSYGWSSGPNQVAGTLVGSNGLHAALWNGTISSWIDLNPAGALSSEALGVTSTHQVGYALVKGAWHASLWSGTAASWVDLHLAGSSESRAYGVFGTQQIGAAEVGGTTHAGLWNGAAASWVDLHPAGAGESSAHGTSGTHQVGVVDGHASLWSGTAGSWLDLHPTSSRLPLSQAWGVSGSQQVGNVGTMVGTPHGPQWSESHASLWSGAAESWVDLSPAASFRSFAFGTTGTMQVGFAEFGNLGNGTFRAGVWSGTAESWVDLGALVPAGFGDQSLAYGIWADELTTYVAGYGYNVVAGQTEALLWTLRLGACAGDIDNNGVVNVNDLLVVIAMWGPCADPEVCAADLDADGVVNVNDLLDVINAWGPCP